ncbi:MarR family transcriptional regulator [Listeria sp. FSL L7-1517]|uniref:MarR family winged helix-turn-helix transcriptional regulator n=1 Tax=Listeria immobilis TaxID=2713502 RepID=UPI00164E397D|nr:MarR family transcriptional regulator [Listeria immobilis]MBC6296969.1 MarR family transcriptional regulator [Listeria immobilis]
MDINQGRQNLRNFILQLNKMEKISKEFGEAGVITPGEINTIEAIGITEKMTMQDLVIKLEITKGAVTQLVDRLEKKGLAWREIHPYDLRTFQISLTPKGISAYKAHEKLQFEFYQHLSNQLTPEEIIVFEKSIEKLMKFLQN